MHYPWTCGTVTLRTMSSLCCDELRWIAGKLLELLSSVMIKLQESFIANFEFTKSFSNTEPMFLKVVGMKREVNMFFQAPDALLTKCWACSVNNEYCSQVFTNSCRSSSMP